jgi:hypothetical protein
MIKALSRHTAIQLKCRCSRHDCNETVCVQSCSYTECRLTFFDAVNKLRVNGLSYAETVTHVFQTEQALMKLLEIIKPSLESALNPDAPTEPPPRDDL